MFCLVYKSKAMPNLGGIEISEMLKKARKFNNHNHITGCLLYYDQYFIHYIEGEEAKLFQLYKEIQDDVRHTKVTLLSFFQIEERVFAAWDLAFEDILGSSNQLHYLKLLISSFIDDDDATFGLNPTSINFWKTTKKLLEPNRKLSHS